MKKVLMMVFVALLSLSFLTGCTDDLNKKKKEDKNEADKRYSNSLEWTNKGNKTSDEVSEWLKIAVENDEYNGDVLQAGTYNVIQTDGEYHGSPQRIYNLYITNLNTEDHNKIQNNSFPYTIGGVNGPSTKITLEKGEYLYIQKISGKGNGHLKLSIKQ